MQNSYGASLNGDFIREVAASIACEFGLNNAYSGFAKAKVVQSDTSNASSLKWYQKVPEWSWDYLESDD